VGSITKSIDARSAGVGDLAVGLWIAEGARAQGEEVLFTSGGYDQVVKAFGHATTEVPTDECLQLGGASAAYADELGTSEQDPSPRTYRWQRTVGWSFQPLRPELISIRSAARNWADKIVDGQPMVVFAPKAAHGSRSLATQKWLRVAWALKEEGVRTVAIDRSKEVVEHFPFFAYGYDWEHVLALLSLATVVAGNDSGIPHLSATIGRPTVVTLGPTIESIVFGHCQDVVRVVSRPDVECFGCHFRFEKGYRVACDHGCEALAMVPWRALFCQVRSALEVD
jgi:hypothetical protein